MGDKSKAANTGEIPEPKVGLSRAERSQVRGGMRLRAVVVYEIVRNEGEGELSRTFSALWWSGLAAGISIGFSFLIEGVLAAHLPDFAWKDIIAKTGYAVGFLIVILGRQQLFTENTLTAVLPVIMRRKLDWCIGLLRLWGIVLAANIIGCLIFALAISSTNMVAQEVTHELGAMVQVVMQNTPWQMFVKGIGAGWIIAALVWMLPSSEGAEFVVIGLMTYLIALCGFTHVVAGSAEVLYGVLTGGVPLHNAIFGFFLPTLVGNVFGGTVLFAVLSYAQVRTEMREQS
jgi:formate/nitrite transporter FocA (FNT family)